MAGPRPAEDIDFADRLRGGLTGSRDNEGIDPGALQRDNLGIDRGLRDLVRNFLDEHSGTLVAKRVAYAREEGLAQLIVLVEDADLRIGFRGEDVLGVDAPLGAGGRVETDRPGEMVGIIDLVGAGGDKKLRRLVRVEISSDGQIGETAKILKGEGD